MHPYAQTARIRRRAFITGTAGVIIIALGAWGFARQIRATFVETKAVELKRVASTVAAQISPADHRSIKENTDQASDGYLRITGLLEEFQSRNPSVRSAYTMRLKGDEALLIVSPPADIDRDGVIDPQLEERDPVGTPLDTAPIGSMKSAAAGVASAERGFTTDRWGTWLTACAPIGSAGAVDGIACVDEDQASVEESMLRINAMAGTMALVAAALLCGMLVAFVRLRAESGRRRIIEDEREAALTGFISAIEHLGVISVRSFDRDGTVRVWNRASEAIFGIPASEAVGSDISAILSFEEDASACRKSIEGIYSSREAPPPREQTILSRDGVRRTIVSSMFPIVEGDEVSEILCLDIDVTGRK